MSDVVIVSRDQFRNGVAGHVPYGTILLVDDDDVLESSDQDTFESMFEGAVPAVDWRGVDQVAEPVESFSEKKTTPKKRGRPPKKQGA